MDKVIDGVKVHRLAIIADERGEIRHMLRRTDPWFKGFGEIYFSIVYPKVVKAWHLHREMTLNYAVVIGEIELVLYDRRGDSPTTGTKQVIVINSSQHYNLVTIPPYVWNGFKSTGSQYAMIANCATLPHYPDEISRLGPEDLLDEKGKPIHDWGEYKHGG